MRFGIRFRVPNFVFCVEKTKKLCYNVFMKFILEMTLFAEKIVRTFSYYNKTSPQGHVALF